MRRGRERKGEMRRGRERRGEEGVREVRCVEVFESKKKPLDWRDYQYRIRYLVVHNTGGCGEESPGGVGQARRGTAPHLDDDLRRGVE